MFYERILRELTKQKVKYLVIGGVAVNLQGYFRATGDLDIFISLDKTNLKKFIQAVKNLGLKPRIPVPLEDLFSLFNPNDPLESTDVMILSPISFDKAYKAKEKFSLGDIKINVICMKDLFIMKEHAGRDKDKIDIRELRHVLEVSREKKSIYKK